LYGLQLVLFEQSAKYLDDIVLHTLKNGKNNREDLLGKGPELRVDRIVNQDEKRDEPFRRDVALLAQVQQHACQH
jgi:hypothetical protein